MNKKIPYDLSSEEIDELRKRKKEISDFVFEQFKLNKMKREIKFRVWDKKNKGFCHKVHENFDLIYADDIWYILGGKALDNNFVMQEYIGLKDKNGKEIYEGDLINFFCDYTMDLGDRDVIEYKNQEVYYDERLAGFYFGKDGFQMLDKIMPETLEVVGSNNEF
ncbi:MAG: hypothetical protein RL736_612 [Pseudomonadota bacterium]|jgi:uncharacterized phage protein (TIGR01671 family)